jgi:hypothetical protein
MEGRMHNGLAVGALAAALLSGCGDDSAASNTTAPSEATSNLVDENIQSLDEAAYPDANMATEAVDNASDGPWTASDTGPDEPERNQPDF